MSDPIATRCGVEVNAYGASANGQQSPQSSSEFDFTYFLKLTANSEKKNEGNARSIIEARIDSNKNFVGGISEISKVRREVSGIYKFTGRRWIGRHSDVAGIQKKDNGNTIRNKEIRTGSLEVLSLDEAKFPKAKTIFHDREGENFPSALAGATAEMRGNWSSGFVRRAHWELKVGIHNAALNAKGSTEKPVDMSGKQVGFAGCMGSLRKFLQPKAPLVFDVYKLKNLESIVADKSIASFRGGESLGHLGRAESSNWGAEALYAQPESKQSSANTFAKGEQALTSNPKKPLNLPSKLTTTLGGEQIYKVVRQEGAPVRSSNFDGKRRSVKELPFRKADRPAGERERPKKMVDRPAFGISCDSARAVGEGTKHRKTGFGVATRDILPLTALKSFTCDFSEPDSDSKNGFIKTTENSFLRRIFDLRYLEGRTVYPSSGASKHRALRYFLESGMHSWRVYEGPQFGYRPDDWLHRKCFGSCPSSGFQLRRATTFDGWTASSMPSGVAYEASEEKKASLFGDWLLNPHRRRNNCKSAISDKIASCFSSGGLVGVGKFKVAGLNSNFSIFERLEVPIYFDPFAIPFLEDEKKVAADFESKTVLKPSHAPLDTSNTGLGISDSGLDDGSRDLPWGSLRALDAIFFDSPVLTDYLTRFQDVNGMQSTLYRAAFFLQRVVSLAGGGGRDRFVFATGQSVVLCMQSEDLGRVTVKFLYTGGGLSIGIASSREDILSLIKNNIDYLESDLASLGCEHVTFSFSHDKNSSSEMGDEADGEGNLIAELSADTNLLGVSDSGLDLRF